MRRLLGNASISALVLIATFGLARAADMPVKAPAVPVAAAYDWSGWYLGLSAGWMGSTVDRHFPTPGTGGFGIPGNWDFSTSSSNAMVDAHVGANEQWGHWVFGIESAIKVCDKQCESRSGVLPTPNFTANTLGENAIPDLYTVGGRLGYAWDEWLVYATGGAAWAKVVGSFCLTNGQCGAAIGVQNGVSSNLGYYAGVGLERVLVKGPYIDLIGGVEYEHFDMGSRSAFCINAGCNPSTGADYNLAAHGDLVEFRLSFKSHGWAWK